MSQHRGPLASREYYHILNRGVARQPVFFIRGDYQQAISSFYYYRFLNTPMSYARYKEQSVEERQNILNKLEKTQKLVDIVAFVLIPNHFHFLLKQLTDDGISIFISKFSNSFTRYINTKHERVGPLFQGTFKAVHIENDEQLLHLWRYISINPVVSYIIKESELFEYAWSSLPEYFSDKPSILFKDPILSQFSSQQLLRNFILDQIDYGRKLEVIKHLTLE